MSLHIYGGPAAAKKDRDVNPFELLRQVRDKNLKLSHAALRKVYVKAARNEPDCVDAWGGYYFDNQLKALDRLDTKEKQTLDEPVARSRQQRTEIEKKESRQQIRHKFYSVMLAEIRTLTFAECAKRGGWLMRIARKGKGKLNQIVGNVLTDAQILAELEKK